MGYIRYTRAISGYTIPEYVKKHAGLVPGCPLPGSTEFDLFSLSAPHMERPSEATTRLS